jgi:hypothetical protein
MPMAVVFAKTEKFHVEATLHSGRRALTVALVGEADDTVDYQSVRQYITGLESEVDVVEFDLGRLARVNSVGAARWSQLLQSVQPRRQTRFTCLSTFAMELAASFPPLLGKPGTPIDAFDVPFQCSICRIEGVQRFQTAEFLEKPAGQPLPVYPCSGCHGRMEFDGIEEEYFRCVRRAERKAQATGR